MTGRIVNNKCMRVKFETYKYIKSIDILKPFHTLFGSLTNGFGMV